MLVAEPLDGITAKLHRDAVDQAVWTVEQELERGACCHDRHHGRQVEDGAKNGDAPPRLIQEHREPEAPGHACRNSDRCVDQSLPKAMQQIAAAQRSRTVVQADTVTMCPPL